MGEIKPWRNPEGKREVLAWALDMAVVLILMRPAYPFYSEPK